MEKREKNLPSDDLRVQIEKVLEDRSQNKADLSSEELYLLLGESLAHQIKLEEQNGELRHLVKKSEDLKDELQRAQVESTQGDEILSALTESSRAVKHQQDFETAARSIFNSCKRLIGAKAGYIALLSDDGTTNDVLYLDTGGDICNVDPNLPMPVRGMREEVYRTCKTIYENDFSKNEWVKFIPTGHARIDNVLFAPLVIRGDPVGLLGLANKPGGFNDHDVIIASAFGEMAAIALFNTQAMDELQNSEERFRSVAQTASEAIITIDSQGKIIFWNKAAETIFGYQHDEAVGKALGFIMPERFRRDHHDGIERVVTTEESHIIGSTVEMVALRKDGDEFPIELSLSSWKSKGEIFFSGIIRDATERKRTEEEIQSLARFPAENRNPVLRISLEGTILYANDASQPLLNLWDTQVGQVLPDQWYQQLSNVIDSQEPHTIEVNCDQRIYALDITPVVEAGYVTLYGKDVTERVQAEVLLKDQNQFIVTVFESLSHPFYVIDASDFTIKMANSAAHTDGLPDPTYCYNILHNQEIPCNSKGYLCPMEEVKNLKNKVVIEHEHHDGLGNKKVYEVHAYPIFNDQGDVTQMIEYTLDVTERKQLERALQQSEKKYRQLIELAREGIWALDKDAITTFVNPRMTEILGYSVEEMQGMHLFSFMDEQGVEISKRNLERRQQGIKEQHDFEFIRKDGTRVYTSLETSPITDGDGNYAGALAIVADITERKQMEEALRVRTHALGERVKELNCLYIISALVEEPGISLGEILRGTVEIIPPSWQYPEITGARIILGGQEFKTENFSEDSSWQQTAEIKVHNQKNGTVQVCYLEERDVSDEGPFLIEERSLINAIAGQLGRIVERVEAGEALQSAHDELELRVQERTAELEIANLMLQSEIVERKRAYEAEQNARQIAETLRAASQALTQTLDMDTVINTLLDYLERLVPFDSANIALLGDEAYLAVRAVRGYKNGMEAEPIISQGYNIEENPQIQDLLTTGESILISDLHQHPGWNTYLELEQAVNWLGVPLVAEDKVIGLCGLDKGEAEFFTEEHLHLAETLIGQATVAIQNAWLFEQVRAGRERLQSLSRRLVEIQESERRYVARELHDEASQALTSLKVGLHLLERDAKQPEAVIAGIAELKLMADEILENLHRLAMDLRPASLDHLGLVPALRQYLESVSDKQGLTIQFETTGFNERLPLDVETALYRIVQETMTNVIRHAQATRVDVILERRQDKIIMIVEDNGVGFDISSVVNGHRLGIVGMRERAEMFGGEFTVERTAGTGTTVLVEVPYANSRADRG